MAKTKQQKEEAIKLAESEIKDSKFLVFADFSETKDSAIKALRTMVREGGSKFSVVKKRLLRVLFRNSKIDFDPVEKYDAHVGTIFAKSDISEVVPAVYKFSKANPTFKLLGGYDLERGEEITLDTLTAIGRLPSRDALLAQVLGGLTGPLRKLMYVLTELANRGEGTSADEAEKAEESAPAEEATAPAESEPKSDSSAAKSADEAEEASKAAEGEQEEQEEKVE